MNCAEVEAEMELKINQFVKLVVIVCSIMMSGDDHSEMTRLDLLIKAEIRATK